MSDEARQRLLTALPHFRLAMEEAKAKGTPGLAVVALNPDGKSGHVTCQFEMAEFFEDLAAVLGVGPSTKEEVMEAEAQQFLDKHGLTVRRE